MLAELMAKDAQRSEVARHDADGRREVRLKGRHTRRKQRRERDERPAARDAVHDACANAGERTRLRRHTQMEGRREALSLLYVRWVF